MYTTHMDVITRARSYLLASGIRPTWGGEQWDTMLRQVWHLLVAEIRRESSDKRPKSLVYKAINAVIVNGGHREVLEDDVINMAVVHLIYRSGIDPAMRLIKNERKIADSLGVSIGSLGALNQGESRVVDWCLDGSLLSEWGVRE
jgi:hypothetical protein